MSATMKNNPDISGIKIDNSEYFYVHKSKLYSMIIVNKVIRKNPLIISKLESVCKIIKG